MKVAREDYRTGGGDGAGSMQPRRGACPRGFCLILLALLLLMPCVASAAGPNVGVLYPELREPYRSVFASIVGGIEDALKRPVRTLTLAPDASGEAVEGWLERERIDVVIALGSKGLAIAELLSPERPVVVGAVLMEASREARALSGIALTPDPEVLFERLQGLAPAVKRVIVIYSPDRNGWLIEHAKVAAAAQGLLLDARPAEDLREAAALYRSAIEEAARGTDAIWLPQDPAVLDEETLFGMILNEAWSRRLLVFSSSPAHVRRGVLFSLYPDNEEMGRNLALLAEAKAASDGRNNASIIPLRQVRIAVNLRTAEHLGLQISTRQQRGFDLVFPSP
jgi:putative tryptophan/tyrosine transport system substrate-binding protein